MSAGARRTNGDGDSGQAGPGPWKAQRDIQGHHTSAEKATNRLQCAGQTGQTQRAMDLRSIGLVPFGLFVGAIVMVSCTSTTTVICPTGKANCPCRPADAAGGVCDGTLVCLPAENRCADLTGIDLATCPAGQANCPCRAANAAEGVCDGTLVCLPAENRCADLTGIDLATDAATSNGDDQSSAQEDASTSDDSNTSQQTADSSEPDTTPAVDSSQTDNSSPPADSGGGFEGGGTPGNIVANGDFSQGMTNWNVQGGSNKQGYPSDATPYVCVTMNSGTQYVVGWNSPTTLDLPPGNSYTLSYKGWTTGAAQSVEAKVGLSYSPYNADLDATDSIQTSQVFTHKFTIGNDDPSAGVAFVFTASNSGIDICFDDVTLVQN